MSKQNIAQVGPISDAIAQLAAERRKQQAEDPLHKALRFIAEHFEYCDLTGDESSMYVVRKAADALGWKIDHDQYGQIIFNKDVI